MITCTPRSAKVSVVSITSCAGTAAPARRARSVASRCARPAYMPVSASDAAAVPAQLVIDTTLTFADRGVHVITFDPERRSLQVSRGALERSTSPPTVPHDY